MVHDKIKAKLISDFKISEDEVVPVMKEINNFTDEIYAIFEKWIDNGELISNELYGLNFNALLLAKENNYIETFILLNWIVSSSERIESTKKLIELAYPQHMIESSIIKIENLQPELKGLFKAWLISEREPEITIEGYSFSNLVNDLNMTPIGAFFTLDWLIREPEIAAGALERGKM